MKNHLLFHLSGVAKTASFLLLLLLLLPHTTQAGGGDTCFAAVHYDDHCNDSGMDGMTQDELAPNVGHPVYATNEHGCWFYGVIEFDAQHQMYVINMDGQEFYDHVRCPELVDTYVRYCVGTCETSRRARQLKDKLLVASQAEDTSTAVLTPEDTEYQHFVNTCGAFEYNVDLLVIEAHLYAVASPETTTTTNCPTFVTSANFNVHSNDNDVPYRKELRVLCHDKDAKTLALLNQEVSHHIGTYPLLELVRAHEAVDPRLHNKNSSYDVIKFNCADFLLALASELNYQVDPKLMTFVARRLVQDAGHGLAQQIRSSLHFGSLFFSSSSSGNHHQRQLIRGSTKQHSNEDDDILVSDQEVIQTLVESRIAGAVKHAA